jgi:hypothetical protein
VTRHLWSLLCLPLLGGCTISAVSESADGARPNSCSSDSECDESSQKCSAGICQAVNGSLESLLIAVTPPSDSAAPHLTFVTELEKVPTAGGPIDLPVLRGAKVTGNLTLPLSDCYPTLPQDGPIKYPTPPDHSLPVSVLLLPRERLLGLPQQLYVTSAHLQEADGTYKYSLQVPPGNYDAYFTLPKGQDGCVVPPQLFRGEKITGDTTLNYRASVRSQLYLHVSWPKGNPPLTGWTIDIVEPLDGKVISSEVVLGEPFDPNPKNDDIPFDYSVVLVYSTVNVRPDLDLEMPNAAHDLVRFRPPAGLAAPTLLMDRTGFGLLGSSEPVLSAFTGYPAPVRLEGWVQRADDGSPVASDVTVVSTEIDGMAGGILSSFQRTVEVDESGQFALDLPPGKYRVQAVPPETNAPADDSLASLEELWTLSPDVAVQAGKVLELRTGIGFRGRSRFDGATVQARPSPAPLLQFEEALSGEAVLNPRSRSAVVEGTKFRVDTDPGRFDVSVRGAESLGFGWWVRPGLDITSDVQDLGFVELPVPTVLTATATAAISNSAVLVAFGAVSAYAYLDENSAYTRDPAKAASVVQVAETRADENGAFRLLIPAQLAEAK